MLPSDYKLSYPLRAATLAASETILGRQEHKVKQILLELEEEVYPLEDPDTLVPRDVEEPGVEPDEGPEENRDAVVEREAPLGSAANSEVREPVEIAQPPSPGDGSRDPEPADVLPEVPIIPTDVHFDIAPSPPAEGSVPIVIPPSDRHPTADEPISARPDPGERETDRVADRGRKSE